MAKEITNENGTVISAVSKTEQFLVKNSKLIWGVVIALVVIAVAGYACYKFVYLPKKAEAQAQMFKAEAAFREGNYELALKGDGNILGFEQIISDYGTKAGKAVYFYAAVCAMKADDPDAALDYISKYSGNDEILAGRAEAVKGDAYVAKDELKKAVSCYEKAAKISDNMFSAAYLLKAGIAYEALGQNDKALAAYKSIKEKYSSAVEAYDIDKYITRVEEK